MVREGPPEEVWFEQRPEVREQASHRDNGRGVPVVIGTAGRPV